jgi:hypothetical protein
MLPDAQLKAALRDALQSAAGDLITANLDLRRPPTSEISYGEVFRLDYDHTDARPAAVGILFLISEDIVKLRVLMDRLGELIDNSRI